MAYNLRSFRASRTQKSQADPPISISTSSQVVRMASKGCSPSSSGRSATSLIEALVHSPSPHYSPSVMDRLEAGTSASPTKVMEPEQASPRDEVSSDGPSLQEGLHTWLRLDPKLVLG